MLQFGDFWSNLEKPPSKSWLLPHIVGYKSKSSIPHIVGFESICFLRNGDFGNFSNSVIPHIAGSQYTSSFWRNCFVLKSYNLGNFIQIWKTDQRPCIIKPKWQAIGVVKFEIQHELIYSPNCRIRINCFLQNGEFVNLHQIDSSSNCRFMIRFPNL